MKIDLDDLIPTLSPDPIILTVGGQDYTVNDLTLAQVLKLDAFKEMQDDAEVVNFVSSLFGDNQPPSIEAMRRSLEQGKDVNYAERQRLMKEVLLIVGAISSACSEIAGPKKLMAAMTTITDRLKNGSEASPG